MKIMIEISQSSLTVSLKRIWNFDQSALYSIKDDICKIVKTGGGAG